LLKKHGKNSSASVADIVLEAVDDTIPTHVLDAPILRAAEG
jgi:hypothetical protein